MSRWLNKLVLPLVGFLMAAVVIGALALAYRRPTPSVQQLAGLYRSPNADDLRIVGGQVNSGDDSATLRLSQMKFGLTGYLDRPLGRYYRIENGKRAPTVIVFDGTDEFSVVDYSGNEHHFRRAR